MQTGMPAGTYEELITCAQITVGADGSASISITNEEEPVFAICQGCTCDDAPTVTATQGPGTNWKFHIKIEYDLHRIFVRSVYTSSDKEGIKDVLIYMVISIM